MKKVEDKTALTEYRNALMRFLTEYGLVAPAILSLARRTELVRYNHKEPIMIQGKDYDEIFFLVDGRIQISIYMKDRNEVVGERGPVTLLGEISYFNKIPATANVHITGREPAHVLKMSYENFSEVINEYPQIKPTLTRIGDMRVISQKDGFSSFTFFMDMIGWKRDRLALNRSQLEYLEDTVTRVLMPRLPGDWKMLDVGDGPGIVCEVIHELDPERVGGLSIQATHLEEAILHIDADLNSAIMIQGKDYDEIFFLVDGRIQISIYMKDRNEVVGERGPVTLLGEISYFNKIPATANVHITGREPAHVLKMSYENFSEVINEYPQIKPTLTRIGDMRVISQKDGFSSFTRFEEACRVFSDRVFSGGFGARMQVHLVNDGPVTIMLDSQQLYPASTTRT